MSEESEDEVQGGESLEEINYRRKYQMLLERCEVLQQDNERLVNRIQHVYNYISQVQKEKEFMINRLNMHNDDWCTSLSQHMFTALNTKSSEQPKNSKSQEPFRRPSITKKSKLKEKDRNAPKKISKDQRRSTLEKIKLEIDADQPQF